MDKREQITEVAAYEVMLYSMDPDGDWPEEKVRGILAQITAEHSGDCTKQPWTCDRCLAEQAYSRGREIADKALAILALDDWRPTHRHVKRGTEYQLIGRAVVQATVPIEDDEYAVVYRGADGSLWVRCADEFNDGRFEALPAEGQDR